MQEDTTKYNGWANRETWLASLWLHNDTMYYSLLSEALELDATDKGKAYWLETHLKDELYTLHVRVGLWSDLIGTAFSNINWLEVIQKNY